MDEVLTNVYSGQHGGDLPYFIGKQYGGGWLRNIARFAFPVVQKAVKALTNTAGTMIQDPNAELLPTLIQEGVKTLTGNNSTKNTKTINKGRKRKQPTPQQLIHKIPTKKLTTTTTQRR